MSGDVTPADAALLRECARLFETEARLCISHDSDPEGGSQELHKAARLRALAGLLAEGQRDTERLDWLEAAPCETAHVHFGKALGPEIATLRAAIDDAMGPGAR